MKWVLAAVLVLSVLMVAYIVVVGLGVGVHLVASAGVTKLRSMLSSPSSPRASDHRQRRSRRADTQAWERLVGQLEDDLGGRWETLYGSSLYGLRRAVAPLRASGLQRDVALLPVDEVDDEQLVVAVVVADALLLLSDAGSLKGVSDRSAAARRLLDRCVLRASGVEPPRGEPPGAAGPVGELSARHHDAVDDHTRWASALLDTDGAVSALRLAADELRAVARRGLFTDYAKLLEWSADRMGTPAD